MDWKDIVRTVAPTLGTLAGGPLVGGVVGVLTKTILGGSSGDPVADERELAKVLNGPMTPELQAKIVEGESLYKIETLKAGIREKEIDAETQRAYLSDVADARHSRKDQEIRGVMILAACVLGGWLALTLVTLIGLFMVLMGQWHIDPTIASVVFTVLGSVIGYTSSNAQQVLSYYFGSSRGSDSKTREMGEAIKAAGTAPTVQVIADRRENER